MVQRETNPEFVNRIANSSGVAEFVRPQGGAIDFTQLLSQPATRSGCVLLSNGEDAVAAFDITAPRVYQAHVMFAKTCRGKRGVETGREMVDWMFGHGADVIWCDIPIWNRPARWFARSMGMARLPSSDDDTEILEVRKH